MCGSATLVTVTSSTCMRVTVMTVTVIDHRRSALMGGSSSEAADVAVVMEASRREGRARGLLMSEPALR